MSDYADPDLAALWLDGDAFRAPAGTALPANIFASTLTGWDPLGGIKAGFAIEQTQENTRITIWNKQGTYRNRKGQVESTIRLRPVDYSKGTMLSMLNGGSIAETVADSGVFEVIPGDDPFFGLIMRVYDGPKQKAYYVAKGELVNIPTETLDGEDVEGWDLEVGPLVPTGGGLPIRKFLNWDPLEV